MVAVAWAQVVAMRSGLRALREVLPRHRPPPAVRPPAFELETTDDVEGGGRSDREIEPDHADAGHRSEITNRIVGERLVDVRIEDEGR